MDLNSYLTAAFEDNGAAVTQHIAHGFSPNFELTQESGDAMSVLHIVTYHGWERSTEALLVGGADPNFLDSSREPPMKMAIVAGHRRIVEILLKHGAKVDVRLPGGKSLLYVAFTSKQTEIAQLLMDHGANPDSPDDSGVTPRQMAGFQAMKASGWDTSKPDSEVAFGDNLDRMSDEGLMAFYTLLPGMIASRVASGEISPAREAMLNALLIEFEQAMSLPLEIRSTRIKEIMAKLLANMGTPKAYR